MGKSIRNKRRDYFIIFGWGKKWEYSSAGRCGGIRAGFNERVFLDFWAARIPRIMEGYKD